MPTSDTTTEVQLGPQGRIVIPAHLRKALDLKPGDSLVVRRDGDSIVVERREALIRRLQARFAHVPRNVDLAGGLIADRRAEAAAEMDN